ncbi:hypothetical protein BDV96DRAFT_387796 [Lophiotrema nucula]|uniref:Uncharacterized protein n=1 Tax=Lophiotrema nucula TaxID=690887 RepID=A0A6A5ZH06_9PLEO|nr:hypothetical protein BDV96DRAFT_387796 [Lophiotrema nucula]
MALRSDTDSSLPTATTQAVHFRSSPPILLQTEPTPDDMQSPVSDPPAKQEMEPDTLPQRERGSSAETERPPSAQQAQKHENGTPPNEQELEGADDEEDPADEIAKFEWETLEQRYHTAMESCYQNEAELLEEFAKLMQFFKTWAETGHKQETERTFSRLRTRMAHVQNSEDQLEKTRNHYIAVVQAFESAMVTLNFPFEERPMPSHFIQQSASCVITNGSVNVQLIRVRKRERSPSPRRHIMRCVVL